MINITFEQAKKIVEAFGDDGEGVATLTRGGGHSGEGLYLGWSGYPDEGAEYLGAEE